MKVRKKAAKISAKRENLVTEDPGKETFTVKLQPRHAQWLERYTKLCGITPEHYIEFLIRGAMAKDPTKGGKISPKEIKGGKAGKAGKAGGQ